MQDFIHCHIDVFIAIATFTRYNNSGTWYVIRVKYLVLMHVIEHARLIDREPLKRATAPKTGNLRAYTYEQVIAYLHNDRTKCHLT